MAELCNYCGHALPNAAGAGLYCANCGEPVAARREERPRLFKPVFLLWNNDRVVRGEAPILRSVHASYEGAMGGRRSPEDTIEEREVSK